MGSSECAPSYRVDIPSTDSLVTMPSLELSVDMPSIEFTVNYIAKCDQNSCNQRRVAPDVFRRSFMQISKCRPSTGNRPLSSTEFRKPCDVRTAQRGEGFSRNRQSSTFQDRQWADKAKIQSDKTPSYRDRCTLSYNNANNGHSIYKEVHLGRSPFPRPPSPIVMEAVEVAKTIELLN